MNMQDTNRYKGHSASAGDLQAWNQIREIEGLTFYDMGPVR